MGSTATRPSSRAYEQTHAFINFTVDLREPMPDFWLRLGEAASKIEHIRGALLKPEIAAELQQVFLIKGAVATTAIEGNTLTERQARDVIEGQLTLPPSQQYLGTEIWNVIDACNDIVAKLVDGAIGPLKPEDLCDYNGRVLAGLDNIDDAVLPGRFRTHSVGVANYLGPPPEDVPYLAEVLCNWLGGPDFAREERDWQLPMAILKAIVAHLYIAWVHPFGDGNGRTARLVELHLLLAAGVPAPAAHLLSNHYNQTRAAYYNILAASPRRGPMPFIQYALQGFVDGLRSQLQTIRDQQFSDRWEQFVYEAFGSNASPSAHRQRRLILALSRHGTPVQRGDLRRLTTTLAEAYATKTGKTLTRDINRLTDLGLLRRESGGYVPCKEKLEAFLPVGC